MTTLRNLSFCELPFAGDEPLALIAINMGVWTSGVSCYIAYPGVRPFTVHPKAATETTIHYDSKGLKSNIGGFPLHLYPQSVPAELDNFRKPELPQGVTIEAITTAFLYRLRERFDAALRTAPLWTDVKETARVILSHPSAWEETQLKMLRRCVENAGWLTGGMRELVLVSEEETVVAQNYHDSLLWIEPFSSHHVVVNECGPSALSVTCFKSDPDSEDYKTQPVGVPKSFNGGFAVAYNCAAQKRRQAQLSPSKTQYRYRLETRQMKKVESSIGLDEERNGDIIVSGTEASACLEESIAPLVKVLTELKPAAPKDAHISFLGNYIGTNSVEYRVSARLNINGVKFAFTTLPNASFCDANRVCLFINQSAFYYYLLREGILESLPLRTLESNALKRTSVELGDHKCYQYTMDGLPIDLSRRPPIEKPMSEAELHDFVPTPPSSDIISNIDKIRESAHVCYTQIQPWAAADTTISFLAPVVESMQTCFKNYTSYLQLSIAASESGYRTSAKCEALCKKLKKGIAVWELTRIVNELRTLATAAFKDAQRVKESFSVVRRKVIKTQAMTTRIVTDLRTVKASFKSITLLDPLNRPPPIIKGLFSQKTANPVVRKLSITPQTSQEANSDILRALQTLNLLEDHLGFVIDWWLDVENRLTSLGSKADRMSLKVLTLEVRSAVTDWGIIKSSYMEYQQTVRLLLAEQ